MLAGRIADQLVDPANVGAGDALNLTGIGHSDQNTSALAVGKSHHFRRQCGHIAHIRFELQMTVFSTGGEVSEFIFFHDEYDAPCNIVMLEKHPSFSIVRIIVAAPPWQEAPPVCN